MRKFHGWKYHGPLPFTNESDAEKLKIIRAAFEMEGIWKGSRSRLEVYHIQRGLALLEKREFVEKNIRETLIRFCDIEVIAPYKQKDIILPDLTLRTGSFNQFRDGEVKALKAAYSNLLNFRATWWSHWTYEKYDDKGFRKPRGIYLKPTYNNPDPQYKNLVDLAVQLEAQGYWPIASAKGNRITFLSGTVMYKTKAVTNRHGHTTGGSLKFTIQQPQD